MFTLLASIAVVSLLVAGFYWNAKNDERNERIRHNAAVRARNIAVQDRTDERGASG